MTPYRTDRNDGPTQTGSNADTPDRLTEFAAGCTPDPSVACYAPWLYSLDIVLPIVDLGQDNTWHPDASTTAGRWLRAFLTAGALLGWVFAAAAAVVAARIIKEDRY